MKRLLKSELSTNGLKVRLYRDTEWEEYQITVEGNPSATYHTDDKQDAMGTFNAMLKDN